MKKVLLLRDSHHKSSEYNLRKKLEYYKISIDDIHFEYVIDRHFPQLFVDKNRLIPSKPLAQRFDELKELANRLKPQLIICAGELSLKALTKETSIHNVHDYVFNSAYECPLIPIIDPKDLYFNPSNGIWIEVGLSKAQLILSGQLEPPSYDGIIRPSLETFLQFVKDAKDSKYLSVDIEKDRHEPHELTTIGFATSPTHAISVPLRSYNPSNSYSYWSPSEELQVWQGFAELLSGPQTKIFHNFVFDCMALWKFGLEVKGPIEDTMNMFHVLHPELNKSLKDAGRFYLFVEPWKKDDQWDLKSHNELAHWNYNLKDVQYTFELFMNLKEAFEEDPDFYSYYKTYSKPLYQKILETCQRGARVDHEKLANMSKTLQTELDPIEQDLKKMAEPYLGKGEKKKKKRAPENDVTTQMTFEQFAGLSGAEKKKYKYMKRENKVVIPAFKTEIEKFDREFNPNSHLQVKDVLEGMGVKLPVIKGKVSTNENALLKLNRKYGLPFIPKLLKYREISKMLSTYCSIPLDPDKRLRYSYNIAGTFGARFSSDQTPWETGCNIQNFPKQFRSVVIPDPGKRFFQVDLSQAELRIVAWLSKDETLNRLLDDGKDLHQHCADTIEKATGLKADRQLGKTVNHARNYGCGAAKLADQCLIKCNIPMTIHQAEEIIKAHTMMFPEVTRWKQRTIQQVQRDRFLVTPTGRKASFYSNWDDRLERKILNFVPQSTVADIINMAWLRITQFPGMEVINQVHDSLLIQTDRKDAKKIIDSVFSSVKILVDGEEKVIPHDCNEGQNWGEL